MVEVGMDSNKIVGIDVGKWTLDVAREGSATVERYGNEAVAIAALVGSLDPARDLVVLERTGGYERLLEAALATAGVRWALAHSKRVKAFREAQGIKAKSDAIDCRLLRAYGRDRLDAGDLRVGRVEDVMLAALVARRRQLNDMLHAERCRHETAAIDLARRSIARTIALLEAELAQIEATVATHIAQDPRLGLKERVMCERIGVAHVTACGLLAVLPQIGEATAKEITALGGIASRVHQSGTIQKRRGLDPGRAAVKVILFNPARTAMRFDPQLKAFAQRLRGRGKPGKVIMVAVMRKMLVQLNAAVRDALALAEERSVATPAAA
jgi:transposase